MFNNYLIPANTKRGKLILGWFRPFDLYLFGGGILTTIVLLAFMPLSSTMMTILILNCYKRVMTCWKKPPMQAMPMQNLN